MKFKEQLQDTFVAATEACGFGDAGGRVILQRPRLKEHGDIASPIALGLAKTLRKNPMEVAERIAGHLSFPEGMIGSIDVARPGFINLRIDQQALVGSIRTIELEEQDRYGTSNYGDGRKCQVEYVSANPTGPLVIVSARAAAVGSVIVNLLRAIGFQAEGEYYVNDYGNQIEALGRSLRFRVRERLGTLAPGEETGAYPGEYLREIAESVTDEQVVEWDSSKGEAAAAYGRFAADFLLHTIEQDLERFGVRFDRFFRESSLHPEGVEEARAIVEKKGVAYRDEGALYFRTTAFGDEKDRVIAKSDGKPTYFLGDIAYHLSKYRRGYSWVLDLLGPDHHGHIPRMKAAASVLGADSSWLRTLIVGWVRLLEGDKPVSMSKRAGEIITMKELIDDVGRDVAKYFFLMRRANSPLDFDLELARKQSDENPVYYVQYAHARISSVIKFAEGKHRGDSQGLLAERDLTAEQERDLMVHLLFYPYEVESAALGYEPHRLTTYARELATLFHQFYHNHRIVTADPGMTDSRLLLARATMRVLRNTLHLLGVDAPSSM